MITIKQCVIKLDVDSTRFDVYDKNKLRAIEHKGHTSGGTVIHYFALYRNDKKGAYFGYYTPYELLQSCGTYQVIYN